MMRNRGGFREIKEELDNNQVDRHDVGRDAVVNPPIGGSDSKNTTGPVAGAGGFVFDCCFNNRSFLDYVLGKLQSCGGEVVSDARSTIEKGLGEGVKPAKPIPGYEQVRLEFADA